MFFLESFADNMHDFFSSRAVQVIVISLLSCAFCQIYKFTYYSIKHKKILWTMLRSTGGFPSSHTSLVITLTLLLGMLQFNDLGYPDWSFAVSLVFAFVTVHDAMGVRYEASKHAIILNNMAVNLSEEEKEYLGFGKNGKLKEMLGHRYTEVLGGALIGILVAIVGYYIVR